MKNFLHVVEILLHFAITDLMQEILTHDILTSQRITFPTLVMTIPTIGPLTPNKNNIE